MAAIEGDPRGDTPAAVWLLHMAVPSVGVDSHC